MELTKEDVLALRLEIAELRREIAELRREMAQREETTTTPITPPPLPQGVDEVSTDQIVTEWLEGEDAWKAKEKTR